MPPVSATTTASNDNLSISSITKKISQLNNSVDCEDQVYGLDGVHLAPSETLMAVNISEAICRGDLKELEAILKNLNMTPKEFDSSYGNLIHISASLSTTLDTFKQILKWTGLSPNSQSSQDSSTALHIATKLDRLDLVEYLLCAFETIIDDTLKDNAGKTCFDYCSSRKCKQIFEAARRDYCENTLKTLFKAAQKGKIEIIEAMTGKPRNLALIDFNTPNQQGDSILHIAARCQNEEIVKLCLKIGIDPFMKNRRGKIALELAKRPSIKQILKRAPMIRSKEIPLISDGTRVQGYLFKYTNFAGGYRKRWFVLEKGIFSYYNDFSEYPISCRGSLNLEYVQLIPNSTSSLKFDIVSLNNSNVKFHLKAESPEEAKRWIISLQQAILALKIEMNNEYTTSDGFKKANLMNVMNAQGSNSSSDLSDSSSGQFDSFLILRQEAQIHQLFELLLEHSENNSSGNSSGNGNRKQFPISLIQLTEMQSALLSNCRSIKTILDRFDFLLAQKNRRLDAQRKEKDLLEDAVRSLASENNKWQIWARNQLSRLDRVYSSSSTSSSTSPIKPTRANDNEVLDSLETHMMETKNELLNQEAIEVENESSSDDDEEEFYDAYESSIKSNELSSNDDIAYDDVIVSEHGINTTDTTTSSVDEFGYPLKGRERIPVDSTKMPSISLWNILKNAIRQQDLTRMPIPINFSEPLSMLQRMSEDLEYFELLEEAARKFENDPARQLLNVAAFAITSYSGTDKRTSKPFNPLLGETFELVTSKFKYLAEQVSHHPPIGASHCSAPGYEYWNEVHVTSRFKGKYLELRPEGLSHLRFKRKGDNGNGNGIHYSWNRVQTAVNNIIVGKLYLEHYGKMRIQSHGPNSSLLQAEIDFLPNGWRRGTCNRVEGKVFNPTTGKIYYKIHGTWNESISACSSEDLDETNKSFIVWKRHVIPEESEVMYNFSSFAMKLNELTSPLKRFLCPTDSRLRPDQRAMEEGEFETAGKLKVKLEEKQRRARKLMEQEALEYQPRWFKKCIEPDTGHCHWLCTDEYWTERSKTDWTSIPDIFI